MSVVYTEKDKCVGCYACIRNCPVKAIRVSEGLAEVIKERCIACGTCVHACMMKAKRAESDLGRVWQFLGGTGPVIALLSTPFPAAFPEAQPGQIITAVKKLGFTQVMEDSFGAELVCRAYARLLRENPGRPFLSSTCPAVVLFIEKYYPQLIKHLAPLVSPMTAMGRVVKWQYSPEAKVVFIGPCIAKIAESQDENVAGVIDAVLTFAELKEMFAVREINPTSEEESLFVGPKPDMGRLFAISGGLLKIAGFSDDILANEIINACGKDHMPHVLREFSEGNINTRLINLAFCEGCLDGPVIDNDLSVFVRRQIISSYTMQKSEPERTEKDVANYADIDLSRKFTNHAVSLPIPEEADIQAVLKEMGKAGSNQMNCGSCGYSSCRELAVAACQGLAETEMCWPYLLEKLRATQEELIQAEKLTSLGQMAASIAHEVNNPIAGVLIYTKLLAKKIDADNMAKGTALGYLTKMEAELTRSSRLIRGLLDFARQSPPTLRQVNINEVLSRSFELVVHSGELNNIQVIRELAPTLPEINADFDQLQQVLTNLILNAVQAMPEGGQLTLHTSADQDYIRVEVQDTGAGISPENMKKLFTPFFTTKEKGKGVGLGLAVAYGIIQRHKGKVEVQSKEGEGATFTIYLPLHPGNEEGG